MLKKPLLVLLFALLPFAAQAQSESQLTEKYATLAGSQANAKILVNGLRDGTDFKIGSTSFDPPTGKMGYGNVNIALSLAEKSLADQGIMKPTAAQLESALIGTAAKPGILALRADGKGWGQIANSMGFRLGELMRSPKAAERVAARPERPAKLEKPERPDRPERPVKPERPERPGR
jgi:hypothetical protein